MTPQVVYQKLRDYALDINEVVLCDIHRHCVSKRSCGLPSCHQLVDFDKLKERFCHNLGMATVSSTDGVTFNKDNRTLFLVEMKSWKDVVEHPVTHKLASKTELDKIAEKYQIKLKKKLEDSQLICCGITNDDHLFLNVPLALVFVTDIDTKVSPLERIQYNLNQLGTTASSLYVYCNDQMSKALQGIKVVNTYYTSCWEFDHDIEKFA